MIVPSKAGGVGADADRLVDAGDAVGQVGGRQREVHPAGVVERLLGLRQHLLGGLLSSFAALSSLHEDRARAVTPTRNRAGTRRSRVDGRVARGERMRVSLPHRAVA